MQNQNNAPKHASGDSDGLRSQLLHAEDQAVRVRKQEESPRQREGRQQNNGIKYLNMLWVLVVIMLDFFKKSDFAQLATDNIH